MTWDEYITGGALIVARHGEQIATKLTEADVREIIRRRTLGRQYMDEAESLSNTNLAEKFGMHKNSIDRIASGKHISKPYRGRTMADVNLIRNAADERRRLRYLASEHSRAKVADDYGISGSLVDKIMAGTAWVRLHA